MFQVTVEVPVETNMINYSKIISFKSDLIDDVEVAWDVFYKVKHIVDTLKTEHVCVNMIMRGNLVAWYRK